MTGRRLALLLVEDSEDDAALLVRALESAGFAVEASRAKNRDGLVGELRRPTFDLVITDHSLPDLRSWDVLAMLHARSIHVPVLIVSGKIGEEAAVAAMRAGAYDYIPKDRLSLLPAAVERALEVARERNERAAAQAALARRERQLADAEEMAHVGGFEWDVETDALSWTDELFRIFGERPKSFSPTLGDFLARVEPGDRDAVSAALQRAIDTGAPFAFEQRIRRPDGSLRILSTRGGVVRATSGGVVRAFGICQDVTDRKKAEEEERASFRQRVELERLQDLDRFKSQLFNAVAHELNTPMTPLMIQLHLLRAGALGSLSPEQRKAVDVLDRNVERLGRLVSDVLDVARLQARGLRLRKEPVELGPLVASAVTSFESAIVEAGLALEQDPVPEAWVHADPGRMQQAIVNLLSNAAKFTPKGGRVSISVERLAGAVRIRVRDTGIGLTEDQVGRLFAPFARVHEEVGNRVPGTGLGLFITKGLIEEHGGTVACESPGPGRGATFTIEVPTTSARPKEQGETAPARERAPAAP
ncbi:MAG: ATP-binding protein [Methanobacteriota archaeon]